MTQKYTVTILDTSGIQPYIFGSNRLRENIGASYLVKQVTEVWVRETLSKLVGKTYFPEKARERSSSGLQIDRDNLTAEVVYAGGGNTVILFKSLEVAKQFTQILSSRVLREAPGINLIVAHNPEFQWGHKQLFGVVNKLINEQLDQKKNQHLASAPLLGLGVTAACNSTQLVAVGTSDEFNAPEEGSYLVSREVKCKLEAVHKANDELTKLFAEVIPAEKFQFPLRFDHLGRTYDESSYVAVVHADGNGMGDRFKKFGKTAAGDRDYITKMRELSWSVEEAGTEALKTVARAIVNSIQSEGYLRSVDREGKELSQIALRQNIYLPFRPLVYGGDDVTFVCDGRLGLTLAALYLKAFEDQIAADREHLTACAGISIAKAHYPFARSYALSEELCKSAKKLVQKTKSSGLDWHIASTGLLGKLGDIREREYLVPEGYLSMRPLYLESTSPDTWRNWDEFQDVVLTLNTHEDWQERRNKVIALREALRQGSEATKKFLHLYKLQKQKLPEFPTASTADLSESGWTDLKVDSDKGRICGYFDAIEAMEFYFPLAEPTS